MSHRCYSFRPTARRMQCEFTIHGLFLSCCKNRYMPTLWDARLTSIHSSLCAGIESLVSPMVAECDGHVVSDARGHLGAGFDALTRLHDAEIASRCMLETKVWRDQSLTLPSPTSCFCSSSPPPGERYTQSARPVRLYRQTSKRCGGQTARLSRPPDRRRPFLSILPVCDSEESGFRRLPPSPEPTPRRTLLLLQS